jgi:hypothetical protein
MFLFIALIENNELTSIWNYHEMGSWKEYYSFLERNMSLATEGQQIIPMLFQDGRVIHCDHWQNGVLTEMF